jgi:hypothetical protein
MIYHYLLIQMWTRRILKGLLIAGFLIVMYFLLSSMGIIPEKNNAAEVNQIDGMYIFIECKPTADYKFLGSEKKSVTWSGSGKESIRGVIKKIRKNYPEADGIIFESIDLDKGDAIKFGK